MRLPFDVCCCCFSCKSWWSTSFPRGQNCVKGGARAPRWRFYEWQYDGLRWQVPTTGSLDTWELVLLYVDITVPNFKKVLFFTTGSNDNNQAMQFHQWIFSEVLYTKAHYIVLLRMIFSSCTSTQTFQVSAAEIIRRMTVCSDGEYNPVWRKPVTCSLVCQGRKV